MLTQRPIEMLKLITPYALIVALVSMLVLALSLRETANMDVLMTRRESSRATRRGLVQRLHLDIVAALVALCGFAVSLYLGGLNNLLDVRTKSLLATPLSLAAPLFLIIAAVLLFFRFYPLLLNLAARLAGQGRGAASMLALAQISRSPGQSTRMILLLALALAFTIFTSVFTTTQNEHARSLASYETGADFSGPLPGNGTYSPTPQEARQELGNVPGITAFSAGFSGSGATKAADGNGPSILFQVRAVDADTFGSTAYWPDQPQLTSMMSQLRARRSSSTDAIPAYVDQLAWDKLNLHVGSTFTISVSNLDIAELPCVVLGKVEHIPTINDSTQGSLEGEVPPSAGVLVDFQTYLKAYQKSEQSIGFTSGSKPLILNQFWMRTTNDATTLANTRSALRIALGSRYDQTIFDRRAILDNLRTDPLSLNLLGILSIGTVVALILAIVGDLLASLLSVRPRLTNFAVLRALGTSPGQVASVLGWEQSLIYSVGILLGLLAGVLLSLTLVPNLVFSGLPNTGILSTLSNADFYALQQIISVQPVFPPTLIVAFVVLAIVFFVALGLMVRTVSRPSMGQVLRLNQD
ncbi:FtsX-like permease family protein [Ktedonospora formicarum]|uniref:FtsX-like permease family protein n=1 Tax=Ktedonospora formicarum TaxID=2778364 RepID=UPI001C68DB8D|nr:FtsX-like permease family protein [Ktedonospora formicarum]